MNISRKTFAAAMALSLGLLAIGGVAHAEHAVIYGPRAEADASSGATQGSGFGLASAQIINGVQTAPVATPGGTSATASTATTNGSAATSQSGGFNGSVLNTSAFASANLASGQLKASVASSGPNTFNSPTGTASARVDDTIYFTNTTSGYLTLNFTYRFDGTIHDTNQNTPQGGSDPSGVANLTFSCSFFYCYNADGQSIRFASGPQNLADGSMEAHFDENGISGFGENIFQSLPPGQQTNFFTQSDHAYGSGGDISGLISAAFLIPPGETSLGFRGLLNLDCRGGSNCDFGHTGQFGFGALPGGLTVGSASGVLLTDLGLTAPGGVPEPATWAMMILGFGMLGAGLRRRSRRALATS